MLWQLNPYIIIASHVAGVRFLINEYPALCRFVVTWNLEQSDMLMLVDPESLGTKFSDDWLGNARSFLLRRRFC